MGNIRSNNGMNHVTVISNLGKLFMNNVMVDLSPCPLTRESALVIINGLYDVATNGGPTGLSVKFHYNTFVNLL